MKDKEETRKWKGKSKKQIGRNKRRKRNLKKKRKKKVKTNKGGKMKKRKNIRWEESRRKEHKKSI